MVADVVVLFIHLKNGKSFARFIEPLKLHVRNKSRKIAKASRGLYMHFMLF